MSLRTPLCDLLGIEHPIVQSGMGGVAGPDLVAEVSKSWRPGDSSRASTFTPDQIREGRSAACAPPTDRPFGVNLFMPNELRPPTDPAAIPAATVAAVQGTLNGFRERLGLPTTTARPPAVPDVIDAAFEVIVDERVPVWSIGLGEPGADLVDRCHARGMKVMAMVTTVEDARTLEGHGVDVLVAQGSEAGGHRSIWVKRSTQMERWPPASLPWATRTSTPWPSRVRASSTVVTMAITFMPRAWQRSTR